MNRSSGICFATKQIEVPTWASIPAPGPLPVGVLTCWDQPGRIPRKRVFACYSPAKWAARCGLTVDEELNLMEDAVRRLKVEYDVFFGGGSKKPPADTEWRVQSLIKKFSDSQKMNFAQRFKYNSIAQRYALYADLWRQKMKIKEEGFRRPQDALLSIAGMRAGSAAPSAPDASAEEPFHIQCSDAEAEPDRVKSLFTAMMEAKQKAGEEAGGASFESFKTFVQRKTEQIRKDYGCHSVEYTVEVKDGHVKLKAKAKS